VEEAAVGLVPISPGAQAYVLKQAASCDLLEAIHTAAAGGWYFCPRFPIGYCEASRGWAQSLRRHCKVFRLAAAGNGDLVSDGRHEHLTEREIGRYAAAGSRVRDYSLPQTEWEDLG
jgi:DNA-binding NarL/FixJ family response regulator